MAVSVAHADTRTQDVWGRHKIELVAVTFDSSYPTGGESFDPAAYGYGYGDPTAVFVVPRYSTGATGSGRHVEYDRTNKKLVVFQQTDPAATGGADAPFAQVANTTDLSTLVVDVLIVW